MTFKDQAGTTPVFWDFFHKTPRRGFHISCLRYWVPKLVFDMCWECEADNSGITLSVMTSFPSCPHRSSKSHRNRGISSQKQTQILSRPLLIMSSECPYVTDIRPYSHWEKQTSHRGSGMSLSLCSSICDCHYTYGKIRWHPLCPVTGLHGYPSLYPGSMKILFSSVWVFISEGSCIL